MGLSPPKAAEVADSAVAAHLLWRSQDIHHRSGPGRAPQWQLTSAAPPGTHQTCSQNPDYDPQNMLVGTTLPSTGTSAAPVHADAPAATASAGASQPGNIWRLVYSCRMHVLSSASSSASDLSRLSQARL